jgi:RsiW-degrading membrane proteinase PrsW (M82 family)
MSGEIIERRARWLNGLPRIEDPTMKWWRKLLRNPWLYVVIVMFAGYGVALTNVYFVQRASLMAMVKNYTEELQMPDELTVPQFNEALLKCTGFALITLAFWVTVLFLVDRLRPTNLALKTLALGWGSCVAVFASLHINTWAASLIKVVGTGDTLASARTAIYVAPFVEEASKATIIFLLAMAVRYRLVTVLQTVPLAGLSAVGFAFTENITYYIQQYIFYSKLPIPVDENDPTKGLVDPNSVLWQMFILRGVKTSWGHLLFTAMTGLGIYFGLKARSKLVRIIAPLAGYLMAAFGHMTFNGMSSFGADTNSMMIFGLIALFALAMWIVRQLAKERAQIAWRLDDYVRMGWLTPRDPLVYSSLFNRWKLWWAGLLRGWKKFRATTTMMKSITELAYLRAQMNRGTVETIGTDRERELLIEIRALRGLALDDVEGLRVKPEWHPIQRIKNAWRRRFPKKQQQQTPQFAPPVGVPVPMR